nr:16S rRNA (uracil(1498)-N(3))-methyltransferase [candidate division Zixibacteria bacterium]
MNSVYYTSPENIVADWLIITGPEAHHIKNVMRLTKGSGLMVVDGLGNGYKCIIEKSSAGKIDCSILNVARHHNETLTPVILAAGISTGYKFDDVIERGTELGLTAFIPMITEKSKVKLEDEKRRKSKLSRWQKVALAAMKQSGRAFLPEIRDFAHFEDILNRYHDSVRLILFDPGFPDVAVDKMELNDHDRPVMILVGPEAGFSRGEIEIAREYHCPIVSLGKRILRTENASPTASAIIMFLLGELR